MAESDLPPKLSIMRRRVPTGPNPSESSPEIIESSVPTGPNQPEPSPKPIRNRIFTDPNRSEDSYSLPGTSSPEVEEKSGFEKWVSTQRRNLRRWNKKRLVKGRKKTRRKDAENAKTAQDKIRGELDYIAKELPNLTADRLRNLFESHEKFKAKYYNQFSRIHKEMAAVDPQIKATEFRKLKRFHPHDLANVISDMMKGEGHYETTNDSAKLENILQDNEALRIGINALLHETPSLNAVAEAQEARQSKTNDKGLIGSKKNKDNVKDKRFFGKMLSGINYYANNPWKAIGGLIKFAIITTPSYVLKQMPRVLKKELPKAILGAGIVGTAMYAPQFLDGQDNSNNGIGGASSATIEPSDNGGSNSDIDPSQVNPGAQHGDSTTAEPSEEFTQVAQCYALDTLNIDSQMMAYDRFGGEYNLPPQKGVQLITKAQQNINGQNMQGMMVNYEGQQKFVYAPIGELNGEGSFAVTNPNVTLSTQLIPVDRATDIRADTPKTDCPLYLRR